jgi:hypothetical protein
VQQLDVAMGVHIEAFKKFEQFQFSNSIIEWKNMKCFPHIYKKISSTWVSFFNFKLIRFLELNFNRFHVHHFISHSKLCHRLKNNLHVKIRLCQSCPLQLLLNLYSLQLIYGFIIVLEGQSMKSHCSNSMSFVLLIYVEDVILQIINKLAM